MTLTTLSHRSSRLGLALIAALSVAVACRSTPTAPSATGIDADAALFKLISETDAFTRYSTFPNAEEFAMGRLSGSEAHAPVVRVRLNATAAAVLVNGRLPAGGAFPDGSIVFKEIRPSASAAATLYAVMVKDRTNQLAGGGWLWAEYTPSGSTRFSVKNRGSVTDGAGRS